MLFSMVNRFRFIRKKVITGILNHFENTIAVSIAEHSLEWPLKNG